MFNKKIKEERDNAEQRALNHFRKLYKIEQIIKEDEKNHEYTIYTVRKIKEVIQSSNINNF